MRAQRTALLRITHGSPSKREARTPTAPAGHLLQRGRQVIKLLAQAKSHFAQYLGETNVVSRRVPYCCENSGGEQTPAGSQRRARGGFPQITTFFRVSPRKKCEYHLIKFVRTETLFCGGRMPCSLPACIHLSRYAMLCPMLRMVCKPSSSCRTSSGVLP